MVCGDHESPGIRIGEAIYEELKGYILKSFKEIADQPRPENEDAQREAADLALRYFQIHTDRNGLKCLNLLQSLQVL